MQLIIRYPLPIFFILAYALSWSSVLPTQGRLLPHGPMLAAILVLALTTGRRGLSDLARQLSRWRVSWIWYLAAPGLVIAFHLGAFVVNLLLGATITGSASHLSGPAVWVLAGELLLLGGMWEEPGWSGYALPRLQERFTGYPSGRLVASLILGALRAGWHLPLLLYGHIPWYDLVFYSFAMQLLISWLYNRTSGSLPIVMLFHLASNLVFALTRPFFTGADQIRYHWLFIAFAWLIVLAIFSTEGIKRSGRETSTARNIHIR